MHRARNTLQTRHRFSGWTRNTISTTCLAICNHFKHDPELWFVVFIFTPVRLLLAHQSNILRHNILHPYDLNTLTFIMWTCSLHKAILTATNTRIHVHTLIHLAICQPLLWSNAVWIQAHKSARVAIEPETEEGFYWPHKNRCGGMFLSRVLMGRLNSPQSQLAHVPALTISLTW